MEAPSKLLFWDREASLLEEEEMEAIFALMLLILSVFLVLMYRGFLAAYLPILREEQKERQETLSLLQES
jgi:hypothetical protein